jgi:hypothetical protein
MYGNCPARVIIVTITSKSNKKLNSPWKPTDIHINEYSVISIKGVYIHSHYTHTQQQNNPCSGVGSYSAVWGMLTMGWITGQLLVAATMMYINTLTHT